MIWNYDSKHPWRFNFLPNECNRSDFFPGRQFEESFENAHRRKVKQMEPIIVCGYDGEHPRRLNFLPNDLPDAPPPVCPTNFNVMPVLNSLSWKIITCDLWRSGQLSEVEDGNIGRKSIDGTLVPGSSPTKCCYLCLHVFTSQLGVPTSHTYQLAPTGLGAPTYQLAPKYQWVPTYQWAPTGLGVPPSTNHGAPTPTTRSSTRPIPSHLSNTRRATRDIRQTLSSIRMQRLVSKINHLRL